MKNPSFLTTASIDLDKNLLFVSLLISNDYCLSFTRDFLVTGDPSLNETSIDLLTNATEYELESFALINEQTASLQ